jgi:hypothetical protein
VEFNDSRITHPSQVVKHLRFDVSTQYAGLFDTLKATLAVLGAHLVRYLHGSGHPAECSDIISSVSLSAQDELSRLDPSVLRAAMFLRAISDYEHMPVDPLFDLEASHFIGGWVPNPNAFLPDRSPYGAQARSPGWEATITLATPSFVHASAQWSSNTVLT